MENILKFRDRFHRSNYSLSLKIIILCVAATFGALALAFSLFQWQDWSADRSDLVTEQLSIARSLAAVSSLAVEGHDAHAAATAEAILKNDDVGMAASYVSQSGDRLVLVRPGQSASELKPMEVARDTAIYRGGNLTVYVPVTLRGRRAGELMLVASQAEVWRSLNRNILVALGLALFGAALSGVAARGLMRNVLSSLSDLEQAIGRVSRTKDFSVHVAPRSNDELGRLTRHFNTLLVELSTHDALREALTELTIAKDAAEEANVMKSEFLSNMSHEIRTPLNGVLGMAQVMAMGELSDVQRAHLDVVQKSGATLLSVLNDLLDLSKIEAGKMELEQAPFDIGEVVSGAYATFTSIANAGGVSFSMSIAQEAAGLWRGDSVRVRQVLYNLISNALKFTPSGEVRVEIEGAPSDAGKALLISISDTGIGIAPEVLPKLFEKFVQADSTMTRRFGGTGLGLTICRQIVELMGGAITVESRLGDGTVFRVILPLPWLGPAAVLPSPPAPIDGDGESAAAFSLEGLRVLAAEDNATNQLVLNTVLQSLGVRPVFVENGRQAVEAWARGRFDLILMDIQMPLMDGVAATREIRRLERETGAVRTRIVALSANVMTHQVAEYLAAGMDAHLAKPIQVAKLYEALLAVRPWRGLAEDKIRVA
ncbi:MAG TPA: ATP-binding protein [Phenylobacterium sp.]|jgi:signal transduction histidine kinase|uniref:ATP-binding protein n=1 Tax=Phenylobacterium sp. TaxID=1871053 RepID=UPI002C6D104A|nr:ATP-binding protein [Phenylobacterium sp.]HXA39704.1 ATP-binding protein [Phenylobacterium sp.]